MVRRTDPPVLDLFHVNPDKQDMRIVDEAEIRFRLKLAVQKLARQRQLLKDLVGPADRKAMAEKLAVEIIFPELRLYTFTAPDTPVRIGDRLEGEG
jgi:hypothetical protein